MDDPAAPRFVDLLGRQAGVVGRRQLLGCGVTDHDIRRLQRRRLLTTVHPGVYVDHTGPLTWLQRAWAAVLACWPAALRGASARRAADGPGRSEADDGLPIEVAVGRERRVTAPAGVRLRRSSHLHDTVLWNTGPPRQRPEYAALELAASARRDVDAVAHLSDVLRARRTTPRRLATALASRPRHRRRHFLEQVITDLSHGTCSTLEHAYLVRVEQPHGLPVARRQFRESIKGTLYRDVCYVEYAAIVELDGRLHHTSTHDRDHDLERDLDAFATDRSTARLGWGQVFDRPCATAARIGAGLAARGWPGAVRRCPDCPPP
ncbi:hypothetical protein KUV85_15745 [Nocardioides panacisoli]|uniref:hypothetical protein n=1 Tax=Nocardioides panacisoli TaxID=627624 RepID=UPI001C62869C|nr:hypothetical protein [Nocardioides panacisoli]QYJ03760.1 hypothetical protein KUV85_15745 [Nocardioides panacisoli]